MTGWEKGAISCCEHLFLHGLFFADEGRDAIYKEKREEEGRRGRSAHSEHLTRVGMRKGGECEMNLEGKKGSGKEKDSNFRPSIIWEKTMLTQREYIG